MNLHPTILAAASCSIWLTASSVAPAKSDPYDETAATRLAKALSGRSAGSPVGCIANSRGSDMQIIDDRTLLFKEGGTVYVQKPQGGCPGLGSGQYTLVTRLHGSNRLCSGQIHEVVDRVSGFSYGSCVFSEFVPYRKRS